LVRALAAPASRVLLTVAAFTAVVVGLLGNTLTPRTGHYPFGMPAGGLAAYLVGATVLRLLRAVPHHSAVVAHLQRDADGPGGAHAGGS
jgi:hypothetical protein